MSQLTPQILLRAYAAGIFPMAESRDDPKLYWIDPEMRGLLPLEKFHVPTKLRRAVRQNAFEVRCNTAFLDVMRGCAEATETRPNTWINAEIVSLYEDLYAMGHAHSVECWRHNEVAGGIYGVAIGGLFAGESMFYRASNASKIALYHLIQHVRERGFVLFDIQMLTPVTRRLGGTEISRAEYLRRLARAIECPCTF